MSERKRRTWTGPLVFAGILALLSLGIERFASPTGGLQLSQGYSGDGDSAIRTGGNNYPRIAMDRDGFRVIIPHRAQRIVSQYWSIDDYLYATAPPQTVVAVSESAYQPSFSNVYAFAQQFHPSVASDAESVLRLNPDLIVAGDDSSPEYISLMRSAGIPVYRMHDTFWTLQQIEDTIRLTGYLTGNDEAARDSAEHFHYAVEAARQRAAAARSAGMSAPRVLGLGGTSYSYGSQTLFHDIVTTLGGVNVAAEAGLKGFGPFNEEQLIRWNPEWIIAGANKGQVEQTLQSLQSNPAIALTDAAHHHHIVVLENHIFQPMSPYSAMLVTVLGDKLYGAQRTEIRP